MSAFEFSQACADFTTRWRAMRDQGVFARPAGNQPKRIGVLVTPWLRTAVPLFSLELASALFAGGQRPEILWDWTDVFFNQTSQESSEVLALEDLLSEVQRDIPVRPITGKVRQKTGLPKRTIELLIEENGVWSAKGEKMGRRIIRSHPGIKKLYSLHAARVEQEITQFDWLLIPGGIFGLSGIYTSLCKYLAIDFTTYDSGRGQVALCLKGVAGWKEDIPEVVRGMMAKFGDDEKFRFTMLERASDSLRVRERGEDDFSLQIGNDAGRFSGERFVLICLNYRADAAALMQNRLFDSVEEWLRAVAKWAVKKRTLLLVRQHPCERLEGYRTHDNLAGVLRAVDPAGRWVHFVSAEEDVNTYQLIRQSFAVLPFTTRVGLEGALFGVPVLISTNAYYKNLSFSWMAQSVKEYFRMLEDAVAGRLTVTSDMRLCAAVCYNILSDCFFVKTSFTPRPDDFVTWVKNPPGILWKEQGFEDILTSLTRREPLAQIASGQRWGLQSV